LHSFFHPDQYKEHGVALASVRAGNVIGGGDWAGDRLIPDCIRALVENKSIVIRYPEAIRPWQHVLEPLSGYLLLAQRLYEDGPIFNGAWNFGPNDVDAKPVRWMVERMTELWGNNTSWTRDPDNPPYEAHYLKLDCSKAKSRISWYPRWNLKTTLEKTIEWYKAYYHYEDMLDITIRQIQNYEKCL
jgi:CDP-glucose 4,6-dehydratase